MNRLMTALTFTAVFATVAPAYAGSAGTSNTYTNSHRCGIEKSMGSSYSHQNGTRTETSYASKKGRENGFDIKTSTQARDRSNYSQGSQSKSSYAGLVKESSFSHATESYSSF